MARDSSLGPHGPVNGLASANGAPARPASAMGAVGGSGAGAATTAAKRVGLADKNLAMLSLPSQDLPTYYDPPSSPSAAGTDSDFSDADFPSSSHFAGSSKPLTNRGNKLSRLAPHTRRGKLGHYANVDAGFADPLMSESALVPPAQKRRKLNDLAPSSSRDGFPVAPNLHLVPRPVHTLSREADEPFAAYLPPVAQSPLDLLLSPAVQHTLGKKNSTFFNLGLSTTGLIEQEAELVAALTDVCRGLRGEGFEWRWDGDDERKKARDDQAKQDEDDRQKAADTQDEKDRVEAEKAAASAAQQDQQAAGRDADAQAASAQGAEADAVKLEQETPVLQPAAAVAPPVNPVPIPGLTSTASTSAPAVTVEQTHPSTSDTPASAHPAANGDVEMADAPSSTQLASATGASAPSLSADGLPSLPSASPGVAALPAGEVPAISVTDASASSAASGATPAPAAASAEGTGNTPVPYPSVAANGEAPAGEPAVPAADAEAGAASGTPAPAAAAPETGLLVPPSAEVTPAPQGGDRDADSEEPARRRSGRVATRGTGGGGASGPLRHTRSRQSSPEDDYVSGEEDSDSPTGEGGEGRGRGQPVPEEDLPEYAQRMVDPEVFVRSRFVSDGNVEMERMAQGPHGGLVGTGQMETLTPNEQEVLLHDCLTDLHRFLADTLEYRSRLGEIRDGVLGVERRRKGMWKVVRTVAMDWLVEEGAGAGFEG